MNFAEVEREVAKLRQDLAAGRLTEEQFKARLRGMMVEDEAGNWWMVGYETGEWYRHHGTDWVRADPPGRVTPEPTPPPVSPPAHVPSRPAPQLVARLAASRLDFWRGLGLALLGTALFGIGDWIDMFVLEIQVSPFVFIPSLFGVLFGPWVGGFAGALGLLVAYALGGGFWDGWLGVALGDFALGMLPGLTVKDARNWKAVLGAGVVAGVILALGVAATYGIVLGTWGNFREIVGHVLIAVLPSNILLLPLFARWLVGPVRRWGLYWRDRR